MTARNYGDEFTDRQKRMITAGARLFFAEDEARLRKMSRRALTICERDYRKTKAQPKETALND